MEDGYFSRGSAVIGKWRSVQFPNHRDLEGGRRKKREVSTDRSLNPGYYREKLAGKFSSSFSLSSSIIEPCNAVSSTRIDRVFTRHATAAAAANISAGRSEYFAGLLPPLPLSLSLSYVSPLECEPLARSYAFWSVWHFLSRLATRSRHQPTTKRWRRGRRAPRSPVCLCKLPKCLVIKANLRERRKGGREKCFARVCGGGVKRGGTVTRSFVPVGIFT